MNYLLLFSCPVISCLTFFTPGILTVHIFTSCVFSQLTHCTIQTRICYISNRQILAVIRCTHHQLCYGSSVRPSVCLSITLLLHLFKLLKVSSNGFYCMYICHILSHQYSFFDDEYRAEVSIVTLV